MSVLGSGAEEPSLDRELAIQIGRALWRIARWPLLLLGLLAGWILFLVVSIVVVGEIHSTRKADVGIVLGGGVTDGKPSAPFEARLRYSVAVYKAGKVHRLLISGGAILGQKEEAIVGRDRMIAMGVPPEAILMETRSWNTYQNFVESRKVMDANGATTALVITEPLHMMRSLWMARLQNIDVQGEPVPTSFYSDWGDWLRFIRSEVLLVHRFLWYRH